MVEIVAEPIPQTMTEKILARASGQAFVWAGHETESRPDFFISSDFSGYPGLLSR